MTEHSVLAAMVLAALDSAEAIGLDVDALCTEAGLDREAVRDPDGRVPQKLDLRLWEALSRHRVGLELGAALGPHGMGAVGHAIQHATSVGEALERLEAWRSVVHPEVVPAAERRRVGDTERLVFSRVASPAYAALREPVYAQASSIVAVMRTLTGRDVPAVEVVYPLGRPRDADKHERFFRCPVRWGAAKLEVAFEGACWSMPLARSDARIFDYLARRADALKEGLAEAETIRAQVRRILDALVLEGEPKLEVVAQRLALSERTLHRRLQDEGSSFAALLDEARRDRALLWLEDVDRSASEIAYALGYTDPASFFRAFKRWTGTTPRAWREARR